MSVFIVTVCTDEGVVVDQISVDEEDVATALARASLGERVAELVAQGERMLERKRGPDEVHRIV